MSVISQMTAASVDSNDHTRKDLPLIIIFATVIIAYLASYWMELQTGTTYKDFWIGCFGAGIYVFCCIVWVDGEVILENKTIPPRFTALIFIVIGGVFTRIFTRAPDNDIVILLKGFGWPGIFASLLSTARLNKLTIDGAQVQAALSDIPTESQVQAALSDEPTDIGETRV